MVPYLKPVFHHYVPYLSFVPWIPSKFVTNLSTNRMSHQLWTQYRIYWWEPQENPRRTPRKPQENLKRTSREPQENPTRNRFPNVILMRQMPPRQYLYHENPKRTQREPQENPKRTPREPQENRRAKKNSKINKNTAQVTGVRFGCLNSEYF